MFKSRRGVAALLAGVLLLGAAASAAYLLLEPRQADAVAMPARDATPQQVVATFVDALNAHDCATAEALTIEPLTNRTRSWCHDVASLTDVTLRTRVDEPSSFALHGRPREVAAVPVSFDLRLRPLHHDGSLEDGPTSWRLLLVRSPAGAPWRIVDDGTR